MRIIPAGGGVFEVTVHDELIFSKRRLGRHAGPGEVLAMVKEQLGVPHE